MTPDTREALVAPYLVAWRLKIERLGHHEFPAAAWRAPGTRNPDVEVSILADGTLESATIVRSSGSAKLDQAALDILKLASPFDPFPQELAEKLPAVAFHIRLGVRRRQRRHGTVTAPGRFTVKCAAWSGVTSLSNHLLIAMPQLADPNFSQTVSLICEHGEKGALGIVLNRPLTMTLSEVFEQMKIEPTDKRAADLPVLRGGPVHQDRGFVLHRPGGEWDSTHKISDSIQVTTSRDVLAAMATGTGPEKAFIALGYAGWEAGQLERDARQLLAVGARR